jgi:hypothetical protein
MLPGCPAEGISSLSVLVPRHYISSTEDLLEVGPYSSLCDGVWESGMRQSNAQTSDREPAPVPPLQAPRGLELIKSSAMLYANGAGAAKPTIPLSSPVRTAWNNPDTERTSPAGQWSVRAVVTLCLFLFVLPGVALAAVVWIGTRIADNRPPELVVTGARSLSAQVASSVVLAPNDTAQSVSNVQSDIIIHKVKTEHIDGGGWAERDQR